MHRVVLITGSTRGIGLATAAEFLKKGDRVVVFCRHRSHASKAKDYLSGFGPRENILQLAGDVREEKDAKRIVRESLKQFGRIDILVNNAGAIVYKPLEKTTAKEWDNILDTNLKGTFLFIRHIVPLMKKERSGTIINVSSAMGVEGEANFSAYCASKFGVVGLTQAVAEETAGSGLRVYAVLPWAVNTGFLGDVDLGLDPSEVLSPEYVAGKIFETAKGRKKSGSLVEIYH